MERRGSSGAPDRQHPCFAVAGVTDSKAPDLNLYFFFLCLVVLFMIADLILLCF